MNTLSVPGRSTKVPHIIELAGIAGAGKSTLKQALMQGNEKIKSLPLPSKLSYLPSLLRMGLQWLPLYLTRYRHTRWFTVQQMRNIGYLDTWIQSIHTYAKSAQEVIVIDPGSVYWLADLRELGPELTRHPRFQKWWKARLEQWAEAMEAIIWVDAPEELCVERVHKRDEQHPLQEQSVEMGVKELKCLRESYGRLIPEMAAGRPLKTFHFRSDQISTGQMLEQLFCDEDLKTILVKTNASAN